jgi:hypothetical protein
VKELERTMYAGNGYRLTRVIEKLVRTSKKGINTKTWHQIWTLMNKNTSIRLYIVQMVKEKQAKKRANTVEKFKTAH